MQQRATPAVTAGGPWTRLPDATIGAHPVGNWLLQMGFDLWIRTGYDREIVAPAHFELAPGSLIASNHQRDVDGPMLGIVLARRRGLHFEATPPFYATREDLFRPGILSRLTADWPAPLSALMGRISLAWFFPLGRTEPMRRVREFTLGETLLALCDEGCGDDDCCALLNARGHRETMLAAGTCPVQAALTRRDLPLESWWGLRRLSLPALRKLLPAFRAVVDVQLAHFASRIDRGGCVYFSPEGTISMDGHFGRIRAGFFRLVHTTRAPPWVQPMALGYDTLAPGRSRVVIRIGERFRADTSLDRRAFDAALRRRILDTVPITPSHLLARFLSHGPQDFTARDLGKWLTRGIATLHARDASLDPLFARTDLQQLASERLRWLQRKRLVARGGDGFCNIVPQNSEPGWRTPAAVVRYLDNSLADLLPDVDRVLPC